MDLTWYRSRCSPAPVPTKWRSRSCQGEKERFFLRFAYYAIWGTMRKNSSKISILQKLLSEFLESADYDGHTYFSRSSSGGSRRHHIEVNYIEISIIFFVIFSENHGHLSRESSTKWRTITLRFQFGSMWFIALDRNDNMKKHVKIRAVLIWSRC